MTDEIPEALAPADVAAQYARIRFLLDSSFVPTVYRRLAVYPEAFALAVDGFASIVESGNVADYADQARSVAAAALPTLPRNERSYGSGVLGTVAKYRAANPVNLLFSLAIAGPSAPTYPNVMEPPLPVQGTDLWQDIRACHGGPILPGLWRDLGEWSDDASFLWTQTRTVAETHAISIGRVRVRAVALDFVSDSGAALLSTDVLDHLPTEAAAEFAWFPTGVATMVVEGELLHRLTTTPASTTPMSTTPASTSHDTPRKEEP